MRLTPYRSQSWQFRLLRYIVASFFVFGIATLSPQVREDVFGCVQVKAQTGTCSTYNPPINQSYNELTFTADTFVDSQSPTTIFGANAKVSIGNLDSIDSNDGQNEQYALVRFDASTIPSDINSVYIRFPLRKISTSNDQDGDDMLMTANRLTQDFIEINGIVDDPKTGEVIASGGTTWNTKPPEDNSETYASSVSYPAKLLSNLNDSYVDLPITNFVKAVKAGTIANKGLIIRVSMINFFAETRPLAVQFNARPGNGNAPWPVIYWFKNAPGTGTGVLPTPSNGPGAYSPPPMTQTSPNASPNASPSANTPLTSPIPTTSPNFPPTYFSPSPVVNPSPSFPLYYFSPSPVVSTPFIPSPMLPPCDGPGGGNPNC